MKGPHPPPAASLLDEALLVGPRQTARHGDLAALDADGVELGELGLPLRTAVTGVAAGHLPLRDCHEPAPLKVSGSSDPSVDRKSVV